MWPTVLLVILMVLIALGGLVFLFLPGRARALEAWSMRWFIRGYEIPPDGPLLNRDSFYRVRGACLLALAGVMGYLLFGR